MAGLPHFCSRNGRADASQPTGKAARLGGFHLLESGVYNARAFLHPLSARFPQRPSIWHWAGYKPQDVRCWLSTMRDGNWPERSWRNGAPPFSALPEETSCRTGSCRWKPVLGSGCRFYSALAPLMQQTPCYLRTYAYLLDEHTELQRLVRAMTRPASHETQRHITQVTPASSQPLPSSKQASRTPYTRRQWARMRRWALRRPVLRAVGVGLVLGLRLGLVVLAIARVHAN